MYKRPPKHIQRTRLTIVYSIMTLAVVTIVAVSVLVVSNYHYNRETGTFEQRGLVQFASTPSAATIEVDGKVIPSRTSTKSSVESGERRFAVWREGYQAWNLTTNVNSGDLVWLNYIRLVPKERPVETLRRYESLEGSRAAPSRRAIIALPRADAPELRYIDISQDKAVGRAITLPEAVYESDDDDATITFSLGDWDESSRYVSLWRHEKDRKELIIVDTRDARRAVNVSRDFSLAISEAHFSGRSGGILYINSASNVRRLNVSQGTLTRALLTNVAQFNLYDTDTLTYVTRPSEESGGRTVGVYQDGDETPTVLRTVADESATVSIAVSEYYDTMYTAITEGSKVDIYAGYHDEGLDSLREIMSDDIGAKIDRIEFNETGSHILMRAGKVFASFGVERKILSRHQLEAGLSQDLFWIDSMHLGLIADNMLTMRDIDGTNVFELNTAEAAQAATLSRNGTYLYSFGRSEGGDIVSQRIRMILR